MMKVRSHLRRTRRRSTFIDLLLFHADVTLILRQRLRLQRQARLTASWETICNTIPGFREEMIELGGNTKLRKKVCQEV